MTLQRARGIAARIWCDQDTQKVVMDVVLAEEIARLLAARVVTENPDTESKQCA